MEAAAAQVTPARDPAAAMKEDEDNKSAPQSPRSASAVADKQPSPPPQPMTTTAPTTMQTNLPPHHHQASPQQQHHQQQHYYSAPNGHHAPPPPPPQQQQQAPDFRGSPSGAAPMSLPSIQHFEGQGAMQSQHQYVPAGQINGAPMYPPPYNPGLVQYQSPTPTMPSNAPNGQNGVMRYAIPHNPMDARAMSGGRHKKEIKRRTKTGCLTCRKRRIKVCWFLMVLLCMLLPARVRLSVASCILGRSGKQASERPQARTLLARPLHKHGADSRMHSVMRVIQHVAIARSRNANAWDTIPSSSRRRILP